METGQYFKKDMRKVLLTAGITLALLGLAFFLL